MLLIKRNIAAALALFLGFFAVQNDAANSQDAETAESNDVGYIYMDYGQTTADEGLLEAYRNPSTRQSVLHFIEEQVGNQTVAEALVLAADKHGLDPALVVSVSWQESRFRIRAAGVNRNGTVDRGLMQLNSSTFKHLSEDEFYEPYLNAELGAGYLRMTMDMAGNTVAALAMYNAGPGRVGSLGAPRVTLDYISKIMSHKEDLVQEYFESYGSGSILMTRDNKPVKNPDLL